jgi:hypothetical protein
LEDVDFQSLAPDGCSTAVGYLHAMSHPCCSGLVCTGAVVQKRSPWRVSIIVDFFLAIVNLIVVL